jgi:hypothetical protein
VHAQGFHILNEVPGRILTQLGIRRRPAAPALVKQYDAVGLGIVQPAHRGRRSGAGTAVNQDDGLAILVAALLEIYFMEAGNP